MGIFNNRKKEELSLKEKVGLLADIEENFSELEAKLKAFFNKGKESIKNKDGNIIRFDKARISRIDDKDPLVTIYNLRDPYKRTVLTSVGVIKINFNLFYEKEKSFNCEVELLAVDDNGTSRWSLIYWIKKHKSTRKYPRVFSSLGEDGLFFAIKDMVVKNSHLSYS